MTTTSKRDEMILRSPKPSTEADKGVQQGQDVSHSYDKDGMDPRSTTRATTVAGRPFRSLTPPRRQKCDPSDDKRYSRAMITKRRSGRPLVTRLGMSGHQAANDRKEGTRSVPWQPGAASMTKQNPLRSFFQSSSAPLPPPSSSPLVSSHSFDGYCPELTQAPRSEVFTKQPAIRSFLQTLTTTSQHRHDCGLLGAQDDESSCDSISDHETQKKEQEELEKWDEEREELRKQLGDGPLRFAPQVRQRSIREQLESLSPQESACFAKLKSRWIEYFPNEELSDSFLLRVARNSPGGESFDFRSSWALLKGLNMRHVKLNVHSMEKQLLTKTLFPLPGVKTLEGGFDVFYMRPCRYSNPKTTPKRKVIDNLLYCMSTMLETNEDACTNGVGFLANMDDWTMRNYQVDYCYLFMQGLQGRTMPVKVNLFLIVNPPSWFEQVWQMMKPMLSEDFQKKVKMIPESDLPDYLAPGYEICLPDEMRSGYAPAEELVRDWVRYRQHVEPKPSTKSAQEYALAAAATTTPVTVEGEAMDASTTAWPKLFAHFTKAIAISSAPPQRKASHLSRQLSGAGNSQLYQM